MILYFFIQVITKSWLYAIKKKKRLYARSKKEELDIIYIFYNANTDEECLNEENGKPILNQGTPFTGAQQKRKL